MPPGRLPVEDFGKCPNESRPLDKPRACSRDNVTHLARKCPVNARRHGWHYKLPCLGLCRKWMYLHKATTLFLLSSTWCWHWLTAGQRPLYTVTSSSVNCASLFISTYFFRVDRKSKDRCCIFAFSWRESGWFIHPRCWQKTMVTVSFPALEKNCIVWDVVAWSFEPLETKIYHF